MTRWKGFAFGIDTERLFPVASCRDCAWTAKGHPIYQQAKAHVRQTGHTVTTLAESVIRGVRHEEGVTLSERRDEAGTAE